MEITIDDSDRQKLTLRNTRYLIRNNWQLIFFNIILDLRCHAKAGARVMVCGQYLPQQKQLPLFL